MKDIAHASCGRYDNTASECLPLLQGVHGYDPDQDLRVQRSLCFDLDSLLAIGARE